MNNSIIIRAAEASDADFIADFSRQTFVETFAQQNTPGNMEKFLAHQFTRKKLLHEVSEPNNFFFIAFDGAEAVGYVKLKDGASPPALENISSLEIARIYVSKKSIGNGIGRLLMEQCIAFAKEKNKELLWLGVWEKNQRAIDFYQRWGFEKFSDHYFQLGDDIQQDWLMKKKL